jgi:preprotein translocase subunit SecD
MVVGVLALVSILAAGCGGSHQCSGTEVTLRAVPPKGQRVAPAGMELAKQIMTSRVDFGVSSPKVAVHGDEIVIQSAGVHNPVKTAALLAETGQLQVFDFEPSLAPPSVQGNQQQPAPLSSLYSLLTAAKKEASKGTPQSYYLFKATPSHPVLQGPAPTLHQLFRADKGGKQPADTEVLEVPANREPVLCRVSTRCPEAGKSKSGQHWYLFKLPPALTGKDLVEPGIAADVDPNSGQPIVMLQFTGHGSREFKRITRAEYDRGRVNAGDAGQLNAHTSSVISRYAGHNAIVLDGQLEQTPYIDYTNPTLSQGIVGNAELTEPSAQTARRTALVLQSGSLPYSFRRVGHTSCPR